jgi:hypothetical protein
MSGNSLTDIVRQSRGERPAVPPVDPAGEEGEEEFPCYAKLRGLRSVAFMLELRFSDGDGESIDYGLLGRVRFKASSGLVLEFANGPVVIRGKNLRPLYEGISAHRVTWVAVAITPARAARDPEATVVTAIEVEAGRE